MTTRIRLVERLMTGRTRVEVEGLEGVDIDAPAELLAAADAGAAVAHLDPAVEGIVRAALAVRTWGALTNASRVLRMVQAFAREDRRPVPPRVAELLALVRAAMRARTASRAPR
jgi:hypothetical protein